MLFSADRQVSHEANFLDGMRFSPVSNPSKTYPCPVCKGESNFAFLHRVLQSFSAEVFLCPHCDYLFVAQPHWLEEAYRRVINIFGHRVLSKDGVAAGADGFAYLSFVRKQGSLA